MNAIILSTGRPVTCYPLTCARLLSECNIANMSLLDAQLARLAAAGLKPVARPAAGRMTCFVRGESWLSGNCAMALARARVPTVLVKGNRTLAWVGLAGKPPVGAARVKADAGTFEIIYPWDLLRINEELVGSLRVSVIKGDVSPHAHVHGKVMVGPGSRILPGVFIEGNVVIGSHVRVGPNCYIRGSTSIGDSCHIGQAVEIKNCIIMSHTNIGHLSYCGDSILGERVNLGAGTITANFRHDGCEHRSLVVGQLVGTGRRKFGTVIGDGVHTGIHTAIYPGRKIWPAMTTCPGEIVRQDLGGSLE
ncbi:MAG: hypothetical protein WCN95_03175 [bacterium]